MGSWRGTYPLACLRPLGPSATLRTFSPIQPCQMVFFFPKGRQLRPWDVLGAQGFLAHPPGWRGLEVTPWGWALAGTSALRSAPSPPGGSPEITPAQRGSRCQPG